MADDISQGIPRMIAHKEAMEAPDVETAMARQRELAGQPPEDGAAPAPVSQEPAPTSPPLGGTPASAPEPPHHGQVRSAMSALEQALTSAGSHTPSGQIILSALKQLGKHFGEQPQAAQVSPALSQLVGGQPQ
jgi:hypothetical protein